ncbi:MerR family transcriptional regulator [Kitasatospora sp. NPDC048286]|uniref:MerR family transcriptional regulator n=1 Tax=Kitasatospora sp. NPDC048286 TaxID=3364047 RepID=UPI00371B59DB
MRIFPRPYPPVDHSSSQTCHAQPGLGRRPRGVRRPAYGGSPRAWRRPRRRRRSPGRRAASRRLSPGVTPRVLRRYEEQGLLTPELRPSGYREYGDEARTPSAASAPSLRPDSAAP